MNIREALKLASLLTFNKIRCTFGAFFLPIRKCRLFFFFLERRSCVGCGMLVTRSKFADVWNMMRKQCLRNNHPVLVFVTCTVDAVCSCKILTELLKRDFISFQVYPVFSYAQLKQLFSQLDEKQSSWEFSLFIELGATVDLLQLLKAEMSKYLLVWDTQRPYHLRNLESKNIFLFDRHSQESWAKRVKTLPFVGLENEFGFVSGPNNAFMMEDAASLLDEEDEREEEDISRETDDETVASFNWDNETCSLWDELKDEETNSRSERWLPTISRSNNTSNEDPNNPRQEHSISMSPHELEDTLKCSKEALLYYAKLGWDACSSSILTYVLARDINQGTLSHVWLAILGLTDHFLDNHILKGDYEMQISFLKTELERYQTTTTTEKEEDPSPLGMLSTSFPSYENEMTSSDCFGGGGGCGGGIDDKSRIVYSMEWKIELMRHWTFYESLMHSRLFVSHFATWKQQGQRDVLELLAILGIPLKDAKQTWNHMNVRCKRLLQSKFPYVIFFYLHSDRRETILLFRVACRHFGLYDICFPSFIRVFSDGSCFSAMDVVLAIRSSLLFSGKSSALLFFLIYIYMYDYHELHDK